VENADSLLARLRAGVTTANAAETRALAAALAPILPQGSVLCLHGDLGVGKTTFVQGLARGLGITESVTSPTFNIFTLHRGAGRTLVHLDAYRLDGGAQLDTLMLEDFLVPPWWLAIEWPSKIADWIPANAWHLDLGIISGDRHTLRLQADTYGG
jgi:tRNA threonylcarbamoyladenosine biosynthesis protein TsaE